MNLNPLADVLSAMSTGTAKVVTDHFSFDAAGVISAEGYLLAGDGYVRRITVEKIRSGVENHPAYPIRTPYPEGKAQVIMVNHATGERKPIAITVDHHATDHPIFVITPTAAPAWQRPGWED